MIPSVLLGPSRIRAAFPFFSEGQYFEPIAKMEILDDRMSLVPSSPGKKHGLSRNRCSCGPSGLWSLQDLVRKRINTSVAEEQLAMSYGQGGGWIGKAWRNGYMRVVSILFYWFYRFYSYSILYRNLFYLPILQFSNLWSNSSTVSIYLIHLINQIKSIYLIYLI